MSTEFRNLVKEEREFYDKTQSLYSTNELWKEWLELCVNATHAAVIHSTKGNMYRKRWLAACIAARQVLRTV